MSYCIFILEYLEYLNFFFNIRTKELLLAAADG